MQAAYALTRLILFGFGWSIAAVLALAAEELLPGVKWPVLGNPGGVVDVHLRAVCRG